MEAEKLELEMAIQDAPKSLKAELRRLHARVQELEAMLESVGAGGVSVQQVTQAMPMNVWQQVVDNALVSAHLGVAGGVTADEAEKILNDLINWNIEVATDPLVNGGKRLVSVDAIADNNQPEATPLEQSEPNAWAAVV